MTSDVRHTTKTLASATLTPSVINTHTQTERWAYAIAIIGVVIVLTSVTVIVTTTAVLLRRWRQTQNDSSHDKGG